MGLVQEQLGAAPSFLPALEESATVQSAVGGGHPSATRGGPQWGWKYMRT